MKVGLKLTWLLVYVFLEGTDYGLDIGTESESTSVKTLDRTYEPEYDEMLSSERSPLPTVIPTTQVEFIKNDNIDKLIL